ncbi:MAG: hypothetical protein ABS76_07530 [Pelagibacterium sp. SCN 64-44]|mgnify:CR=1 FL=1|nr:MAG: hypothetical protein ABS76_07530 [Pelagibacterium sp. SCN 64-44]
MNCRMVLLAGASCLLATMSLAEEAPLEGVTTYVSASEAAALKVFVDRFDEEGGEWIDSAIAGGGTARATAIRRILGGDPPGAAQFVGRVTYQDLIEADLLKPMTNVAVEENWQEILPPWMWEDLQYEGEVYAAPIQRQTQTVLYYSQDALEQAGIELPEDSVEGFFGALDAFKAAGLIPFAASSDKSDLRRVFLAVTAAVGGPELYNRIYVDHDTDAVMTPEFLEVAKTYHRLYQYTDAGQYSRTAGDSTNLLIEGKAGVQILGDWGKGDWLASGATQEDFHCQYLGGIAVESFNVLIFPKSSDPGVAEAQDHFARVITADPELQVDFTLHKGSIPTHVAASTERLDDCANMMVETVANPETAVRDDLISMPPQLSGAVADVVIEFWNDQSMAPETFAEKYAAALEANRP